MVFSRGAFAAGRNRSRRNLDIIPGMDNRRYRNGSHQVRGNARRPFRHVRRIQKIANSATVHYSLLPIRYSDSTPSVVLCYDAMGRQTRAVDAAGITTFAYDSFGSLTNETVIGVAGTNTIERLYDAFGRDAGYALNGVRQSTLAYDPSTGRLATMLAAGSETPFAWSYLAGSELKSSLTYPNGIVASWAYDSRNNFIQVRNASTVPSSPSMTSNDFEIIFQYDYTYDAAGRRIGCAKSGSAFTTPDTNSYLYNTRSELTNATAAVDSAYRYSYDFDDIGNRNTSSERDMNATYAANNLNQYMSVDAFVPQYDADGNQTLVKTATGVWSVTYNGENRPIRWKNGDTVITMSFDRMGRRVTKNAQRFVYDGYLQIANHHSSTSTSYFNYYIWDPTEPVATRPLAWQRGTSVAYYTHDGNKNVSEVIASNTDVAAHYEYAPFGALTISRGGDKNIASSTPIHYSLSPIRYLNPWRFSSEYAEDDTATVYYNYRHYEPVTGRWMQRDPIEEEGGISLYSFNWNLVLGRYDVLGLYLGWDDGIVLGAGFLGGLACTGVSDLVNWELSSWETYLGNGVTGAIFSEGVYLFPGLGLAGMAGLGAVSSGAGNLVAQAAETSFFTSGTIDACEFEVSIAMGAAFGLLPVPKVPKVNAGQGSYLQIARQIHTVYVNGSRKSMRVRTVFKAAAGSSWNAGIIYTPVQDVISDPVVDFAGYLLYFNQSVSLEINSATGYYNSYRNSVEVLKFEIPLSGANGR